jgi:cellulose synthase/poly-beta-1,6-N-acetylglucosamine synthase-like glycosyltransferase
MSETELRHAAGREAGGPRLWAVLPDENGSVETVIDLPPVPDVVRMPEVRLEAHRVAGTDGQAAGLAHLERIAAEQAQARGVALEALKNFVTGPMAAIVTGPMAAVTALFRPRRPAAKQPPSIAVLLPAHNEAANIAQTIRSLRRQTVPVDSITVICDNCTDDTADIAAAEGAEVMVTEGNTARKAGALNQGFAAALPWLRPDDLVLVMDADSRLSDNWIEDAARCMAQDRSIAGACGTFAGEPGNGLIGQLQRNEYARAARLLAQRDRIWVLSGCGTLLRVSALREIAYRRGADLGGAPGEYYDSTSITEDFELTLAMMTLGYQCKCVTSCVAYTELMPTWKNLRQQRLRWQKGTIRDLRNVGITRVTWRHWLRLMGGYLSYLIQMVCLGAIAASLVAHEQYNLPWGIGVLGVTLLERLWTCRSAGWKGQATALLTAPELLYNIFLASVMFRALVTELARRDITWNHVDGPSR